MPKGAQSHEELEAAFALVFDLDLTDAQYFFLLRAADAHLGTARQVWRQLGQENRRRILSTVLQMADIARALGRELA